MGNQTHLWLHLASSTPGGYSSGEQFAITSNTDHSTAQALTSTTGLKELASGEWVRHYADVLHLPLNPNAAIAQSSPTIDTPGMVELIKSFEGFHPKALVGLPAMALEFWYPHP
ncbi:hypothetical protein [Nodosilinea sp. E11]|uniref:hypothetical protein n=1 Tax=Nodosilinea sp. E11 TaxID=3037479 RepID=UPI0029348CB8|nr:hypothetical protein [Nodosilinea sp. E11]WOD36995.1 hypothetical protein RRF56_00605 [Nodosilinea sp. E11]